MSGTRYWPPIAAIIAKLRQFRQRRAKSKLPLPRIAELQLYRLDGVPVVWARMESGVELALSNVGTSSPRQAIDVATLRAKAVRIDRAAYRRLVGRPEPSWFDVEGIPVLVSPGYAATAWDVAAGRPFPTDSAWRNGAPISEARFLDMVSYARSEEWRRSHPQEWAAIVKRNFEATRELGEAIVKSLNESVLEESEHSKKSTELAQAIVKNLNAQTSKERPVPKPPPASPEYLKKALAHNPALLKKALERQAQREAAEAIARAAAR